MSTRFTQTSVQQFLIVRIRPLRQLEGPRSGLVAQHLPIRRRCGDPFKVLQLTVNRWCWQGLPKPGKRGGMSYRYVIAHDKKHASKAGITLVAVRYEEPETIGAPLWLSGLPAGDALRIATDPRNLNAGRHVVPPSSGRAKLQDFDTTSSFHGSHQAVGEALCRNVQTLFASRSSNQWLT